MSFTENHRPKMAEEPNLLQMHPTQRFEPTPDNRFRWVSNAPNAGLVAYALEQICQSDRLRDLSSRDFIDSLRVALEGQAIIAENGTAWWRWEKKPSFGDFVYPVDWDDQLKAMDALKAYNGISGSIGSNLKLPSARELVRRILNSLHEAAVVGEDVTISSPHKYALYIFDETVSGKPGNKEDIFVTAVVLESGRRHGLYEAASDFEDMAMDLFARLTHVAEEGLTRELPFHTLSRCYCSWAHFLYLLREIAEALNAPFEFDRLLALYKRNMGSVSPTFIEAANERHDMFYRRKLGLMTQRDVPNDIAENTIVYRHRRLSHFYGSHVWEIILEQS